MARQADDVLRVWFTLLYTCVHMLPYIRIFDREAFLQRTRPAYDAIVFALQQRTMQAALLAAPVLLQPCNS